MAISNMVLLILDQVRDFLEQAQTPAYFVGGCVRDLVLGRPLHDLDLVVPGDAVALARQIARMLHAAFVLLDQENGIARVVLRAPDGEIGDTLDFATMRGPDLASDLAARDFTINAMAMMPADFQAALRGEAAPTVIDPYGGQKDLRDRCLRAVSERSFLDDPLRTMRAVRFAGELDFQLDPQTRQWAREAAPLLAGISWERIRDELARLLACDHAAPYLPLLDELQLLPQVLPELEPFRRAGELEHLWETVCCLEWLWAQMELEARPTPDAPLWQPVARQAQPLLSFHLPYGPQLRRYLHEQISDERTRLALLKVAALLHGIGSTPTVEQICRRLRLSSREALAIAAAVAALADPVPAGSGEDSRRLVYRFYRDVGDMATGALLLALAIDLAVVGRNVDLNWWKYRMARASWALTLRYERYNEVIDPPRLLDGAELMELLGLKPGPLIGRLLESIREAQAAGQVHTREEAIAWARERVEVEAGGQRSEIRGRRSETR